MNAITGFSAAYAIGQATDASDSNGSGAVPIGLLVAEKMRHIRKLRKFSAHPTASSPRP